MMTSSELLRVALEQSALELGVSPEDFLKSEPITVLSERVEGARRYLTLPFSCQIVSYGSNAVASVSPELRALTEKYIKRYPTEHLFETPNLQVLNDALTEHGQRICFMAEYFLPDVDCVTKPLPAVPGIEVRRMTQPDFADLYRPEWSNALCEARRQLDVLGFGAYDAGRLVGLAACSADCDTMWQIGIDVLPAYRRRGIASYLTRRLAREILAHGRVPFYCAAWSNLPSVRNAIRAGFRPAWVEMTAKPLSTLRAMNGE